MENSAPNYGLSKMKIEPYDDENFINPLPRAVIRPNSYILLDGDWKYCLDSNDVGLQNRWYLNHEYTHISNWPGSVEKHMEKNETSGKSWNDKVVIWYEREFLMPEFIADNTNDNRHLQLTFGACGYETRVWLNGFPLTTIEGEEVHI